MSTANTHEYIEPDDMERAPLVETGATTTVVPVSLRGMRSPPNPLPKLQLAAIFAVKIIIPTAAAQVMPYANAMIEGLAASEGAKTGYYSGILVRSEYLLKY